MNQRELILEYIRKYRSITQKEASDDLGITRLASRISELIADGVPIVSEFEVSKNRFGKQTRYKRYRMKEVSE